MKLETATDFAMKITTRRDRMKEVTDGKPEGANARTALVICPMRASDSNSGQGAHSCLMPATGETSPDAPGCPSRLQLEV